MNPIATFLALGALATLAACGPVPVEYVEEEPMYGASVATSPGYASATATSGSETVGYAPATQTVTIEYFQQVLAPYGQWVDVQPWGLAFVPSDASYVPYRQGHWEYTDEGMVWVSAYEWATWTEHYGRWAYLDGTGWVWVPDTTWGPAWVEWRDAGTMVGWAPLGPAGWTTAIAMQYFVFVEVNVLFAADVWSYYAPAATVAWAYPSSSLVGWGTTPYGTGYCPGPSYDSLSRRGVRVMVSRPDARRVGRPGGSARPSVAVRPAGDRPRVGVVGPSRPTVGVVAPASPTVTVRPDMRPAAGRDALAEDARRRWVESARPAPRVAAPVGPTVQPSPIGRETQDAEWAAGVRGGREASDAEVRAALGRAQEAERVRQLAGRPVHTPNVAVVPRPTAPPPAAPPAARFGVRPSVAPTPTAPAPGTSVVRPIPMPPPRMATPTPAFGRPAPPPAVIAPPPRVAAPPPTVQTAPRFAAEPRFATPPSVGTPRGVSPPPGVNAPPRASAPRVSTPPPTVNAPPSRPRAAPVTEAPARPARPAAFAPGPGAGVRGVRR